MKTKNITLIGPLSKIPGGIQRQLELHHSLLTKEGYNVSIINCTPKLPLHFDNIRYLRALLRLILFIFNLLVNTKKNSIWHVYANSGKSWWLYSVPALIVGKLTFKKVILNYRGGGAKHFIKRNKLFFKFFFNFSTHCVVSSNFLLYIFKSFNLETKIIPNTVDKVFYNGKNKKKINKLKSKENIYLLITRNLEKIYNIESALYALRDIVKINDKVILKIAGSGQNRDELIHLSKILQIENHVQFLGSLSRAEIIHEYSTSDILINTSIVDNMPNSLLESMASGLPIVSYKVGGISFFFKTQKKCTLCSY